MKNILTYSTLLTCCSISNAATVAIDNFDDNSIDGALWDAQVLEKDDSSAQDISLVESSQRLNLSIDTPPDIPVQSYIRQSLTTNFSASTDWTASVNITNQTDITQNPSVRIGLVVSDSTRTNFGGIYLKADNNLRILQNAGFGNLATTGLQDSGTIYLEYNSNTEMLSVSYANGIGNAATNYQTIDTSAWDNTATNGFRFHLQSTVAGTANGTGDVFYDDFSAQSVPEPSSALLISIGLIPLLRRRR